MNIKEILKNKKILLAAAAVCVAIIALLVIFRPDAKPAFMVESFTIETEVVNYEYMDDTVNYTGTGVLRCSDAKNTYLVLVEYTDATSEENTGNMLIVVQNGVGVLSTHDYGIENTTEEPQYSFTVLNYTKMENVQ
ncbi:MAG: hypothetical protein IKU17_07115 [Clostridia bacterium]|nr:hypothetical protein [Clostridia bacterium]